MPSDFLPETERTVPAASSLHRMPPEEVLALFEGVRASLGSGGTFALDMYAPHPKLYERDPDERYGQVSYTDPRSGEPIESWEQSGYDAARQIHQVRYIYVYAVALHDTGDRAGAVEILRSALTRLPGEPALTSLLESYEREP